jgi:hypothetical protein
LTGAVLFAFVMAHDDDRGTTTPRKGTHLNYHTTANDYYS